MSDSLKIRLSGRRPVVIDRAEWPVIAEATAQWHDGEIAAQANRVSVWSLRVRQHEDGRAVVYAQYRFTSNMRNDTEHDHYAGRLLDPEDGIEEAIASVAEEIETVEHFGSDATRWPELAYGCIADMPAEEI